MTDDGTRNEFVYHIAFHARLASKTPRVDLATVSEFVYARVFMTEVRGRNARWGLCAGLLTTPSRESSASIIQPFPA
jgi:hypothetical protein